MTVEDKHIVFQGETQLAGWTETHTGGVKVTLWLADHTQLGAFRTMTVRKGNTAGQRLAVVMVEIGDDEQPVAQVQDDPIARVKGGSLCKLAVMLCTDPAFQAWMWGHHALLMDQAIADGAEDDEQACARAIRAACGVDSRRDLDHDERAAKVFHSLFRVPYVDRG